MKRSLLLAAMVVGLFFGGSGAADAAWACLAIDTPVQLGACLRNPLPSELPQP